MKKLLFSMMAGLLIIGAIAGCGNTGAVKTDSPKPVADAPKNTTSQITEEEALAFVKEFIDVYYKKSYKDQATISDYNKFITPRMREQQKEWQDKEWKEFSTEQKEQIGQLKEIKTIDMITDKASFQTKVLVTYLDKNGKKILEGYSNGKIEVQKREDGKLYIISFSFEPDKNSIKTYSVK